MGSETVRTVIERWTVGKGVNKMSFLCVICNTYLLECRCLFPISHLKAQLTAKSTIYAAYVVQFRISWLY